MAVAERLLREHGGFPGLMKLSAEELARIHGTRASQGDETQGIDGDREPDPRHQSGPEAQDSSPDDITNLIGLEMSLLEQEQLRIVLLNTRNEVIGIRTLYQGTSNQAQVRASPRSSGTQCGPTRWRSSSSIIILPATRLLRARTSS